MFTAGRALAALALGCAALLPIVDARAATVPVALELSYAAYVHGFRALVLTVDLTMNGDGYTVALADHTVGLVGAIINNSVRSEARGRITDGRPSPSFYSSRGRSRGADRATAITYAGDTPTVTLLAPVEPNRDRVPPAQTVGSIDPLSLVAALFAHVEASGRCDDSSTVFDGARLSTVRSWTVGPVMLPASNRSPYAGTAIECAFRTQELAGFLHDADFIRAHQPEGGTVWLATPPGGKTMLPIRARFSTVEHGEIGLYLIKDTVRGATAH
jgi:hypothetical protein